MIKTGVALVVTLAVCIAPGAMAHPRTYHAHTSHSRVTIHMALLPTAAATNGLAAPDLPSPLRLTLPIGVGRA